MLITLLENFRDLLYGVEDGGWIIHRTEGIDSDGKAFFTETLSDTIGKARPYKDHLLTWPDSKPRFLDIYYRPKLHLPNCPPIYLSKRLSVYLSIVYSL